MTVGHERRDWRGPKTLTSQLPGPLQIAEGLYLSVLEAGSVLYHKPRLLRLNLLENVQHDVIGPVSNHVYVLITEMCEFESNVPASVRTTCQPRCHACLIFSRITSGSVVSKPEVELLSEYGASKEAPQDPKAPTNRQRRRLTPVLQTYRP